GTIEACRQTQRKLDASKLQRIVVQQRESEMELEDRVSVRPTQAIQQELTSHSKMYNKMGRSPSALKSKNDVLAAAVCGRNRKSLRAGDIPHHYARLAQFDLLDAVSEQ